jgi:hypothetical protein
MTNPTPVSLRWWGEDSCCFEMPDLPKQDLLTLDRHFLQGADRGHLHRARDAKALYALYSYHPDVITLYSLTLSEAGESHAAIAALRKGYGELTGLLIKAGVEKTLDDRNIANRPYARLAQHYLIQLMHYARSLPEKSGRDSYRRAISVSKEIQSFIPPGRLDYDYWVLVASVALGDFSKILANFKRRKKRRDPEDWLTYAWALFQKGDSIEGDAALRRVIGRLPGHCAALLLPDCLLPSFNPRGMGDWAHAVGYAHYFGAAWHKSPQAMAHLGRYRVLLIEILEGRNKQGETRNELPPRLSATLGDPEVCPSSPPVLIIETKVVFWALHRDFGLQHPEHFKVCQLLDNMPDDVLEGFNNLAVVLSRLTPAKSVKDQAALKALRASVRAAAVKTNGA